MHVIEWKDLYLADYGLFRLAAIDQKWNDGQEFLMLSRTRPTSALLYLKDSRAEYLLPSGKTLSFPQGSLLYFPQGCRYRARFFACGRQYANTQLIEFELRDTEGQPFACSQEIMSLMADKISAFEDSIAEAILCYSQRSFSFGAFRAILYNLLTRIAKRYQTEAVFSREYFPIAPAIRYLIAHPYGDTDIASLAQMCHLSENCFRNLFKQYSGKTPSKYCLDNRMLRAKQLLENGLHSVAEVAAMVGFRDAGYFTKVFKKETGILPGQYGQLR
ncbi:MAG: helix-turn-helix transcriptional regulator [Oscillospiraceae bacterium]|nr:helix-turn-helix transcriptional regulator [Oscillospiraceae bacterium]